MVKVLKHGKKKRVKCSYCGALLEYDDDDIKCEMVTTNEYDFYIICPDCGKEIQMP